MRCGTRAILVLLLDPTFCSCKYIIIHFWRHVAYVTRYFSLRVFCWCSQLHQQLNTFTMAVIISRRRKLTARGLRNIFLIFQTCKTYCSFLLFFFSHPNCMSRSIQRREVWEAHSWSDGAEEITTADCSCVKRFERPLEKWALSCGWFRRSHVEKTGGCGGRFWSIRQ